MHQLGVSKEKKEYVLKHSADPAFISGGGADVFVKTAKGELNIGGK